MRAIRDFAAPLAALALGLGAVPADAQLAVSTADLLAACQASTDGASVCHGYLLGLADMQKMLALMHNGKPFFCTPPIYGAAELIGALEAWVAANPDAAGMPAMNGAIGALQVKFPCQ